MNSLSTILIGVLVYFILKSIYRKLTDSRSDFARERYQEISIGEKSVPHERITLQNKKDHEPTSGTRDLNRRTG